MAVLIRFPFWESAKGVTNRDPLQFVLIIHMAVDISTTVSVPQNLVRVLTGEVRLSVTPCLRESANHRPLVLLINMIRKHTPREDYSHITHTEISG